MTAPDTSGSPTLDPEILAGLRQLAGGGSGRAVDELVLLFLDTARERVTELRTAVDHDDSEALARVAHSLKGSSANLAASGLAALAAHLEVAARAGDAAAVPSVMALVEAELERVDAALRTAFPGVDDLPPSSP